MKRDIEVLNYLVNSINDAVNKLDQTLASGNVEKIMKIKKTISDLSKQMKEELA